MALKRIQTNSYEMEVLPGLSCPEPTMAQQHMAQECDVNLIVDRALKTGILGDQLGIQRRAQVFGDFSEVGDFHTALNKINEAQNAFMELPPDVRAKFDNDPASLIQFLQDPKNEDEAVALGLAIAKPKPMADPVLGKAPTVPPAAPAAPAAPAPGA